MLNIKLQTGWMRKTTEENRGCSERIYADGFFHGGGATSDTILKKKHIKLKSKNNDNNMSKFFIKFLEQMQSCHGQSCPLIFN